MLLREARHGSHLRLRKTRRGSLDLQLNNVMSSNKRSSRELTDWADARPTGGLQNGSCMRSRYGAVEMSSSASERAMTPILAHKLKHNKSILALAVSADTLFAGTEGGEILVRSMIML